MLKKRISGLFLSLLFVGCLLLVGACRVGAWNVLFPSSKHETTPPDIPGDLDQPALLVFSKTNGFRHFDGIEGGLRYFENLTNEKGWGLYQTENSAIFNSDDLALFSVVIFNNATGDLLSTEQELAFQAWLEGGGSWLGIHSAGDASHAKWTWYMEHLIGTLFTAHIMGPQFQIATLHVDDTSHVATTHLPPSWQQNEEWYSWEESVRGNGFNVLLTVDETTYSPMYNFLGKNRDLRMGDHPVAWNRCVGNGRSVYTALGHKGEAFQTTEYQKFLEGAIHWLLHEGPCGADE